MDFIPFIKQLFSLKTLRDYEILNEEKRVYLDVELEEIKSKKNMMVIMELLLI